MASLSTFIAPSMFSESGSSTVSPTMTTTTTTTTTTASSSLATFSLSAKDVQVKYIRTSETHYCISFNILNPRVFKAGLPPCHVDGIYFTRSSDKASFFINRQLTGPQAITEEEFFTKVSTRISFLSQDLLSQIEKARSKSSETRLVFMNIDSPYLDIPGVGLW